MFRDTLEYLPDDVLVKTDRASMAASLELRCPLLDQDVVELAWQLPVDIRLGTHAPRRGPRGKPLLRAVLERRVPHELVTRSKRGFSVPIGQWLRGPLREWAESLLEPAKLDAMPGVDAARARSAWHAHQLGRRDLQYALWPVLMLQAWREHWNV